MSSPVSAQETVVDSGNTASEQHLRLSLMLACHHRGDILKFCPRFTCLSVLATSTSARFPAASGVRSLLVQRAWKETRKTFLNKLARCQRWLLTLQIPTDYIWSGRKRKRPSFIIPVAHSMHVSASCSGPFDHSWITTVWKRHDRLDAKLQLAHLPGSLFVRPAVEKSL